MKAGLPLAISRLHHNSLKSTRKKGISNIIAAVYLLLILLSAFYTLYIAMNYHSKLVEVKEQRLYAAVHLAEIPASIQAVWTCEVSGFPPRYVYTLTLNNSYPELIVITSVYIRYNFGYYYITHMRENPGGAFNVTGIRVNGINSNFPVALSPGDALEITLTSFTISPDKIEYITSSFTDTTGIAGKVHYLKAAS